MIPRTLEPEVMDTEQEAIDYDAMDHSEVNRLFVEDFASVYGSYSFLRNPPSPEAELRTQGKFLDIGTGTAQIPVALLRLPTFVDVSLTAIDMAEHMLRLAARNVAAAGLVGRIHVKRADAKRLPFGNAEFEAVISNSIIHHIPNPVEALAEMVRVFYRPMGILFVRDLLRPDTYEEVDRLVATYAGDANAHQQAMFRASLCAALTLDDVRDMLKSLDLPVKWVGQTSDRHWTLCNRL